MKKENKIKPIILNGKNGLGPPHLMSTKLFRFGYSILIVFYMSQATDIDVNLLEVMTQFPFIHVQIISGHSHGTRSWRWSSSPHTVN